MLLQTLNGLVFHFGVQGYKYMTWALPLGLLYGPVFYIGTQEEEKIDLRNKKYLPHLLPFAIGLAFYFLLLFSYSYREQYGQLHSLLLHLVVGISFFSYSVWRLKNPKLQRNRLQMAIPVLCMVLAVGIVLPKLGEIFLQSDPYTVLTTYIWYGGLILILACLYLLLVDALRIVIPSGVKETVAAEPLEKGPISADGSPGSLEDGEEKVASWHNDVAAIEAYMAKHPYLQEDFDIKKMVADLDIPRYVLNEFFTEYYQETFAKKINLLRIDYACGELSAGHYGANIDELWKRCGFRSRASFYRNFSQVQGCTPLAYRNRYTLTK